MSYESARVTCPLCKDEHEIDEVEFLDIEEDMEGRDVMTYTCPVFGIETKAIVWRRR